MSEVNQYIISGGVGLIVILFGAVIWFVQRLIKTLDRIDSRVYQIDNILVSNEARLNTVEIDVQRIDEKLEDVGDRFLILETEHRTCVKCHPTR